MRTPRPLFVLTQLLLLAALPAAMLAQRRGTLGISIADLAHQEGSGGTDAFLFQVRVNRDTSVAAQQVSVFVSAASGTAQVGSGPSCQPGDDVILQQTAVTIPANQPSQTLSVTICTDGLDEADNETFTLNLTNPLGATIADAQAIGTIIDDDAMPNLRVNDVFTAEGNPGAPGSATVTITLSAASGRQVSVVYNTQAGSATAGAACGGNVDYVTPNATAVFNPGVTQVPVVISYCGDTGFESNETFTFSLSSAQNATIADGSGSGRIENDDQQSVSAIAAPLTQTRAEGSQGPTPGTVVLTNSATQPTALSATIAVSGSAVVGSACTGEVDVALPGGAAAIQWGPNDGAQKVVTYTICGDTSDDADAETFIVTLTQPTGGATISPAANTMTLTITDDDAAPTMTVPDLVVTEPSGFGAVAEKTSLTITLSAPSNRAISATLAATQLVGKHQTGITAATGGSSCGGLVDFITSSHVVTFAPRVTTMTVQVSSICADARREGSGTLNSPTAGKEVFQVQASAPSNTSFAKPTGYIVICDP
jgi:hypothetical protein